MNLIRNNQKAVRVLGHVGVTLTMATSNNNDIFMTHDSWRLREGTCKAVAFSVLIWENSPAQRMRDKSPN
jgi:hypothetical protein